MFNGENYDFRRIRMTTIFKSHVLWKMVQDGYELSESDDETQEELSVAQKISLRENVMRDAKALGIMQGAVSDATFPRYQTKKQLKLLGKFCKENAEVTRRRLK